MELHIQHAGQPQMSRDWSTFKGMSWLAQSILEIQCNSKTIGIPACFHQLCCHSTVFPDSNFPGLPSKEFFAATSWAVGKEISMVLCHPPPYAVAKATGFCPFFPISRESTSFTDPTIARHSEQHDATNSTESFALEKNLYESKWWKVA